jgi:hypothetical protein
MAKNSWVDKAAESGDCSAAEKQARRLLNKSGAQIRNSRQTRDREKIICFGEGEEPEAGLGLDTDDRVEELIEDQNDDALPPDEEERALSPVETTPATTLSVAYEEYLRRGGNRRIPNRVMVHLGLVSIDRIDRSTIIDAGRKLYPGLPQVDRAELVHDPIEEVLGGARGAAVTAVNKHRALDAKYEGERDRERLARYHAEQQKYRAAWAAWALDDDSRLMRELGLPLGNRVEINWTDKDAFDYLSDNNDTRWAKISKPSGPPADPVEQKSKWRPPTHYERWAYKHRGLLTALRRPDGALLQFGPPPHPSQAVVEDGCYYGWERRSPGRPPNPNKLSNAEKQKAYRQRLRGRKHK